MRSPRRRPDLPPRKPLSGADVKRILADQKLDTDLDLATVGKRVIEGWRYAKGTPDPGKAKFFPQFEELPHKWPQPFTKPSNGFTEIAQRLTTLDPRVPIALFPVRLETRFSGQKPNVDLRLRIMPDKVFVRSFEEPLSKTERRTAQAFQDLIDKAEMDADEIRAQWRGLCANTDPLRLAWAMQVVRGTVDDPGDADTATMRRAQSLLLPEYWFVTGMVGEQVVFQQVSTDVSPNLAFTPDPDIPGVADDPSLDPALEWMFDFAKAEAAGMALRILLPPEAQDRIDALYVVGVKQHKNGIYSPAISHQDLAIRVDETLRDHHYHRGAGFVSTGTPTNSTGKASSGWTDKPPEADALFIRELAEAAADPLLQVGGEFGSDLGLWPQGKLATTALNASNAGRLADALGLPDARLLRRFEHREGNEDARMRDMNRLIWPTSIGEFFNTMMDQPGKLDYLGDDFIEELRTWFVDHVRGGPVLPTLRLGDTPYGVMPIKATRPRHPMWHRDEVPFETHLKARLEGFLAYWLEATDRVLRLAERNTPVEGFDTPGARLLEILRYGPNPGSVSASTLDSIEDLVQTAYARNVAAVSDVQNSQELRDAFTISADDGTEVYLFENFEEAFPWPEAPASATALLNHIRDQRQIVSCLIDMDLVWPWTEISMFAYGPAYSEMVRLQNLPAVQELVAIFDQLEELVVQHIDRGFLLRSAGFPTMAGNGLLGPGSTDPPLSFLVHGVTDFDIDPRHFLVVPKRANTVDVPTYVDYLIAYAESFLRPGNAPEPPTFPDGQTPLFYDLMKSAIEWTGTRKTETTFTLSSVLGEFSVRGASSQLNLVESLSGPRLAQVSDAIDALTMSPRRSAPRTRRSSAQMTQTALSDVGRILITTSPRQLAAVSDELNLVLQASQPPDFPQIELRALTDQLKMLAEAGPSVIRADMITQLPNAKRKELGEIIAALGNIRDLVPDQIELLMMQSLGLSAWRLDAWVTSLANAELKALRAAETDKEKGVQVGGYGFVFDLERNPEAAAKPDATRSQGFIQAPSLTHAKTAAVLRAGWHAYGTAEDASPFAVDLSSERMRLAARLFDAVRQGQDPGEALGAIFEQALSQTTEGAGWILPMRRGLAHALSLASDATDKGIDGLELLRVLDDATLAAQLRTDATAAYDKILTEARLSLIVNYDHTESARGTLARAVDAMADAAIADAVHALVQGNTPRAGATLRAIQTGEAPPPELEVLRTPDIALSQVHKVVLSIGPVRAVEEGAEGAPASRFGPAHADPALERLAEQILSPLFPIALRYTLTVEAEVLQSGKLDLQEEVLKPLGMGWLDVLRGTAASLMRRARVAVFARHKELTAGQTVDVQIDTLGNGMGGQAGLDMLGLVLDSWRRVVFDARPFDARDIPPDATGGIPDALLPVMDLEHRAGLAKEKVLEAMARLLNHVPEDETGARPVDPDAMSDEVWQDLLFLARAEVEDALPEPGALNGSWHEVLAGRVAAIAPKLRRRAAQLGLSLIDSDATLQQRIKAARAMLRAAFGDQVQGLLPVEWEGVATMTASFRDSDSRVRDPSEIHLWLDQVGHVHDGLAALNIALNMSDCLVAPDLWRPAVSQWPESGVQEWIAQGKPQRAGPSRSMVALSPHGLIPLADDRGPVTALIVGEITDRVPMDDFSAGLAVHVDSPNAEAPQAVLLALPEGTSWSHQALLDTLQTAAMLAKIRLVDGTTLSLYNQIIPAIYAHTGLVARLQEEASDAG